MTQYDANIIPNPLGSFEAFVNTLSDKEQYHGLVSAIIDDIEEKCQNGIRSRDAYTKLKKSLEIHFFRVYALGIPWRGSLFAMVCCIVDQESYRVHLLGGWLCETDDETERAMRAGLDGARQWVDACFREET